MSIYTFSVETVIKMFAVMSYTDLRYFIAIIKCRKIDNNDTNIFKLPNQPKSTLRNDFYKLLKKEVFCDLKFLCVNVIILKVTIIISHTIRTDLI